LLGATFQIITFFLFSDFAVQQDKEQGQENLTRQSAHICLNLLTISSVKHTQCKYIQNKCGPSETAS